MFLYKNCTTSFFKCQAFFHRDIAQKIIHSKRKYYEILTKTLFFNKILLTNVLFYDLGFQVIDSHGRTYGEKYSFVNSDIFYHEAELMKSAYYAKKIPQ